MSLTPSYGLTALQCPVPISPADQTLYSPTAGNPAVVPTAISGTSAAAQNFPTRFNQHGGYIEAVGRYGGGAYGVAKGCELSAAGLTATVASGAVMLDVEVPVSGTLTLSDNVWNFLWVSQGGTLNKRTSADAAPLTAPGSGLWSYLGALVVAGGSAYAYDLSGVCFLRGRSIWRRTAEAGAPGDAPPATLALFTRTASGLWFWDGTAHTEVGAAQAALAADLDQAADDLETARRLLREVLFWTQGMLGYPMSPELQREFDQATAEAG